MELKLLNREELTELYRGELVYAFPAEELKPLAAMLRLVAMGRYEPLLALEGGGAVGYALLWRTADGQGALLEYLGVLRGKRNGGAGTRLLAALGERYGQLFGEVEAPGPEADEAENALRRRRIAFYERSGFRVLDYECALFGVRFHCIYRGPETDDRRVEAMHRGVYAAYFSPAHMERYLQIPLAPGEAVKSAPGWVEEALPGPVITLGERTAESAARSFEEMDTLAIRATLPMKAKTAGEAVADFYASQRPGASSFGRTILADGRQVGDVWCYGLDPDGTPNAMVSYCVFEQALRGQGAATQALALFLAEIVPRYRLKTVGAFTYADNLPSIRVLIRNGFRLAEEFTEGGRASKYFELQTESVI